MEKVGRQYLEIRKKQAPIQPHVVQKVIKALWLSSQCN